MSHPYKTTGTIVQTLIYVFIFSSNKGEETRFYTEW